jgi:hypothetical protein
MVTWQSSEEQMPRKHLGLLINASDRLPACIGIKHGSKGLQESSSLNNIFPF